MLTINERSLEAEKASSGGEPLIITMRNDVATQANRDRLSRLPLPEFSAQARVIGKFSKDSYPTDETVTVRKGARIMMVKNGPFWVNGLLGDVAGWSDNAIEVIVAGQRCWVEREKWDVIDYRYNRAENRVEEFVIGSFEQFPIKLGWAITIHKSQGQTFENVNIDMTGGAFAHGQLYEGLSRCTSLEGIRMLTPVARTDMCFDERVQRFIERSKAGGHVSLAVLSTAEAFPTVTTREVVDNAMRSHRPIQIRYGDFYGNESSRAVTPMAWVDGDMFLAQCHLRHEERHFRLSRILQCEPPASQADG